MVLSATDYVQLLTVIVNSDDRIQSVSDVLLQIFIFMVFDHSVLRSNLTNPVVLLPINSVISLTPSLASTGYP